MRGREGGMKGRYISLMSPQAPSGLLMQVHEADGGGRYEGEVHHAAYPHRASSRKSLRQRQTMQTEGQVGAAFAYPLGRVSAHPPQVVIHPPFSPIPALPPFRLAYSPLT